MPGINKLAATKVARLTKPGRYGDGAGLWLQVAKAGSKSWIFQFTSGGEERQLGLGSFNTVSLGEARKRAKAARDQVAQGIDPIEAKKALREEAALEESKGPTFQEVAADYIAAKSPEWRNPRHRQQWSPAGSILASQKPVPQRPGFCISIASRARRGVCHFLCVCSRIRDFVCPPSEGAPRRQKAPQGR